LNWFSAVGAPGSNAPKTIRDRPIIIQTNGSHRVSVRAETNSINDSLTRLSGDWHPPAHVSRYAAVNCGLIQSGGGTGPTMPQQPAWWRCWC